MSYDPENYTDDDQPYDESAELGYFDPDEYGISEEDSKLLNNALGIEIQCVLGSCFRMDDLIKKVWNNFIGDDLDTLETLTADKPDQIRIAVHLAKNGMRSSVEEFIAGTINRVVFLQRMISNSQTIKENRK